MVSRGDGTGVSGKCRSNEPKAESDSIQVASGSTTGLVEILIRNKNG